MRPDQVPFAFLLAGKGHHEMTFWTSGDADGAGGVDGVSGTSGTG